MMRAANPRQEQPPANARKRRRVCKSATYSASPNGSTHSGVTRVADLPEEKLAAFRDGLETSRQDFETALSAIKVVLVDQGSNPGHPVARLFQKNSVIPLARFLFGCLTARSLPIIIALSRGEVPVDSDLLEMPVVRMEPNYNVKGVYLHTRRVGERFGGRGLYIGVGGSSAPDTYEGFSNLIGILRRVAQHNSPSYRAKANKDACIRNNYGVYHYRKAYEDVDTSLDHEYIMLAYLDDDEMRHFLGQPLEDPVDASRWYIAKQRHSLLELLEAALIAILGTCGSKGEADSHVSLLAAMHVLGFTPPTSRFEGLNRTPGLEKCIGPYAQISSQSLSLDKSIVARLAAGHAFGRRMGKSRGESATLHEYMEWKEGTQIVLQHRRRGGAAARDARWVKWVSRWSAGEMLQRRFTDGGANLMITDSAAKRFTGHLPLDVPRYGKLLLKFPTAAHEKWKPPRGHETRLFWDLKWGVREADGTPTGEGLELSPWLAEEPSQSANTAGSPVPIRYTPALWAAGEPLIYNQANAARWDQSAELRKASHPRYGQPAHTYSTRWLCFIAWLQHAWKLYLATEADATESLGVDVMEELFGISNTI